MNYTATICELCGQPIREGQGTDFYDPMPPTRMVATGHAACVAPLKEERQRRILERRARPKP